MISGLYSAASGMICEAKKQETIARNLIGAPSPGFKKSTPIFLPFAQVLKRTQGHRAWGAAYGGTYTSQTQGEMKPTQRPLDFSIDGEGFFSVQTPGGTLYTRNGSFQRANNGKLTTSQGYPVLGERGEVTIPQGTVLVNESGKISVNGENVGQIKVVKFDQMNDLTPIGGGLFRADPSARPIPQTDSKVRQGFLEMSNVSLFREMTDMVFTMRCYETCQKIITLQDGTLGKAINEIGRIS